MLMIRSNVLLSVDANVIGRYEFACVRSLFGFGMTVIVACLSCGGI